MIRFACVRWWLLACALALGCGAAKPRVAEPPPPPKPPEDPFSWLPEQATTMGRVELDHLRKTPMWAIWSEVEREQNVQSWVDLRKVERVTFGGTGETREDLSYVAALEGEFAPTELRDLAARDGVQPELQGLLTIYRRPDGAWTQITPALIVTCSLDRVEALVARAGAGPGTAIKEAGLYRSLAERVGFERAHLTVLAEDPEGKRKALVERQAARLGLGSIARDSVRMGVGLEVGGTYRLVAVAEAADGTRAQALEADVRDKLDALSANFLVRILGIGKLVSSLRATSDGNYVAVRGEVAEEELNQLLTRMHNALNVAGSFGVAPGQP